MPTANKPPSSNTTKRTQSGKATSTSRATRSQSTDKVQVSIKRRHSGTQSISWAVDQVSTKLYNARGFTQSALIRDWASIVGPSLAKMSTPRKISRQGKSGSMLHLDIYDSGLALQMKYEEPLILEKIATYVGHRSIKGLIMHQVPTAFDLTPKEPWQHETVLSEEADTNLNALLKDVDDEDLAAAIKRLGANFYS
jgi:hypothetical protein